MEKENQILDEFRKLVADLKHDDRTLRRFLIARNYNTQLAEEMIRQWADFREKNDLDNSPNWEVAKDAKEAFCAELTGKDHENRWVLFSPLGAWPTRQFVEAGRTEDAVRAIYKLVEYVLWKVTKSEKDQCLMILDFAELSFWNVVHYQTMQLNLKLFRQLEAHWPETIGEVLIINAPAAFHWVWPVFKPVFSGTTLSKISVFGSNEKTYMPEILKRVPVSSLPPSLQKFTQIM